MCLLFQVCALVLSLVAFGLVHSYQSNQLITHAHFITIKHYILKVRVYYCYVYLVGVRGQVVSLVSCLESSSVQVVASCPTSDPVHAVTEGLTQPM